MSVDMLRNSDQEIALRRETCFYAGEDEEDEEEEE